MTTVIFRVAHDTISGGSVLGPGGGGSVAPDPSNPGFFQIGA